MKATLRVLSIGSPEACNAVCDALLVRQRSCLTVASSANSLYAVSTPAPFDVAVLHPSLSVLEMRDAGALIRSRWPTTRILAIAYSVNDLESPLFDVWREPGITCHAMLSLLERMAMDRHVAESAKSKLAQVRSL